MACFLSALIEYGFPLHSTHGSGLPLLMHLLHAIVPQQFRVYPSRLWATNTEQMAQRIGSSLVLTMPLSGWGKAVRGLVVVVIFLVGPADQQLREAQRELAAEDEKTPGQNQTQRQLEQFGVAEMSIVANVGQLRRKQ